MAGLCTQEIWSATQILLGSRTNVHRSQSGLKIGEETREILQSVRVRQGDNMAPVLFHFLMTAFAKLIEKEYDRNNIKKIELH